jgi:transposase
LPEDLPRVDVVYDIGEDQKLCACGFQLSRIGEEISEKLDIIPAKMQVIRNIRYKYACKNCEGVESDAPTVQIAPAAAQIIPKSLATEGLLAHIVTAKFEDALPLYRQSKIFNRMGIDLSRATMAGWMVRLGGCCQPLIELLKKEIRSGPVIGIDETTVQVLNEPGRSNTAKSYMWVFRGGPVEQPILLYVYSPTRAGKVAMDMLAGYEGFIQTDGYIGYDELGRRKGIFHVGCWSHARRMFIKVINARKKGKKSKGGNAEKALDFIRKLYAIEKEAKAANLDFDQIYRLRQQKAKPILDEFKKWLVSLSPMTPPKGLLGKAVSYTLSQWDRLERYIEDGRLRMDNNLVENAIRPFVVGRKNWLFSGHPNGANASAALYSLIETAKANGLEPYAYLRYVFEKLPLADKKDAYRKLLPQNLDRETIRVVSP